MAVPRLGVCSGIAVGLREGRVRGEVLSRGNRYQGAAQTTGSREWAAGKPMRPPGFSSKQQSMFMTYQGPKIRLFL